MNKSIYHVFIDVGDENVEEIVACANQCILYPTFAAGHRRKR